MAILRIVLIKKKMSNGEETLQEHRARDAKKLPVEARRKREMMKLIRI
jgi:hypothetical protein